MTDLRRVALGRVSLALVETVRAFANGGRPPKVIVLDPVDFDTLVCETRRGEPGEEDAAAVRELEVSIMWAIVRVQRGE